MFYCLPSLATISCSTPAVATWALNRCNYWLFPYRAVRYTILMRAKIGCRQRAFAAQ